MMMKKLALAFMLALLVGAFASQAVGARRPSAARGFSVDGVNRRKKPARRVARRQTPAVALPVVTEIDGEGLRKLLQRGEGAAARPLLINFWATWCVPCRKEMPDLVKIDRDYRGRGLEFVVISADDVAELKADVPKFLSRMRAGMPAFLLNATDTEAAMAQVDPTWGGELPATFLFDRHGKLVFKHTGIINAAELRAQIEKAVTSSKSSDK
ncbi:MAG TPA: TlpA disulfide reductase family protein [Pyrinomonadaceae bacterium]|jgi:thiol-disulfide isomerase/thioredoxin|nr:TlpA disulfide reductase family protein [Pyrinomonadaceae bacterium]